MSNCTKTVDNKVVLSCKFSAWACHRGVCKEPSRVDALRMFDRDHYVGQYNAWGGARCPQFQPITAKTS
jgi:hypothetical protein